MHCRSIRVLRQVALSRKGVVALRRLWPATMYPAQGLSVSLHCRASNTSFEHPNVVRGSHVH